MKKPLFDLSDGARVVRVVLAHVIILLSALVITFFIIDRFNTAMEFMSSELSKWFIGVLALLSLVSAVMTVAAYWVNPDGKKKR